MKKTKAIVQTDDLMEETKGDSTYGKAFTVTPALGLIKNKGLSVQNLMKVIKLKAELTIKSQQYNEAITQIMEKFEVESTKNGIYEYGKHANWKSIQKELKDLIDMPIEIKEERNFLTWADLQGATPDIDTETIAVLAEWLVKD